MTWRTRRSGIALTMAAGAALTINGRTEPPGETGPLRSSWTWTTRPGQVVEFERLVSLARSPDGAAAAATARAALKRAQGRRARGVVGDHQAAWSERWARSEVEVDGDPAAQRALRFAAYHLNSAANPDDERVSIGARALTGSDYGGHVFWDTDIYLLPFYCHTWPEAARWAWTSPNSTSGETPQPGSQRVTTRRRVCTNSSPASSDWSPSTCPPMRDAASPWTWSWDASEPRGVR